MPNTLRSITVFVVIILLLNSFAQRVAYAHHSALRMPFLPGSTWGIIRGYKYASHPDATYQEYSLDLVKDDGQTTGQPVLAAADGRFVGIDQGPGCVVISLFDGHYLMTCHLKDIKPFTLGQLIRQGEQLGVVAPAGEAGNEGTPHIHITLYSASSPTAPRIERIAIPFDNAHGSKLDGYEFRPDGTVNQHAGISGLQSTNGPFSRQTRGVFHNLSANAGGTVYINLLAQDTIVSGTVNFTHLPEDPIPLCGAGDFTGTHQDSTLLLSFTSNDTDTGCGYDRNAVFTMTTTLDRGATHLWGTYQAKNANGSRVSEAPGVFEVWTDENQPGHIFYSGTLSNSSGNQNGLVIVEIIVGNNTVSGFVNFSNHPNEALLCGAGEFTGSRDGDAIVFSFVSNDPDSGCGFDRGLRFQLNATLTDDLSTISGEYYARGIRQGSFSAERTTRVFFPNIGE
jgi:hypothetical protein